LGSKFIPIETPRNIQFTKLIKINGRQCEFNFRKRTPEEFDVDTVDDRGNRIMFKLIRKDDNWSIQGNNGVGWLVQYEKEIGAVAANY
jgi:hypothetical protein